jgi:hypothetical protein
MLNDSANVLVHCVHLKGFSPVCTFKWRRRVLDWTKDFVHWVQLKGFSPVCILIWCWSDKAVDNGLLQLTHTKGFSFRTPLRALLNSWKSSYFKICVLSIFVRKCFCLNTLYELWSQKCTKRIKKEKRLLEPWHKRNSVFHFRFWPIKLFVIVFFCLVHSTRCKHIRARLIGSTLGCPCKNSLSACNRTYMLVSLNHNSA